MTLPIHRRASTPPGLRRR